MRFLDPPPTVVTFDCYGTLVQWREVFREAIVHVLQRCGSGQIDPIRVLDGFSGHAHRMEQLTPHRAYKQILRDGFASAFADHHVAASRQDVEEVAQAILRMGPHQETRDVLTRLRQRYRLAIFTNSDDDLISHNLRLIGVPIDHVITAEQANAYKPSPKIFEFGHRKMSVTRDEVVHVAMSMPLDIQPCHDLGIRCIWINRLGIEGNPAWLPYAELSDLRGVPALLGL